MKHPASFQDFLRTELAPFPGRLNATARCIVASAIVILVSMTLEVPYLVLSLFMVFCVTQANIVLTRLIGIMFVVGSTLAIGILIVMLEFTFDEPFLRILAASLLVLGSVYLSRVTKIGIVFFAVAITVIYGQTFVDLRADPEWVVRQILWVWVAVNYSIAVTLAINSLLLPIEPEVQLRAEMGRQLAFARRMLAARASDEPLPDGCPEPRQAAVALMKLSRFAAMRSPGYRRREGWHLVRIAAVSRLYRNAHEFAQEEHSSVDAGTLADLGRDLECLQAAVAGGTAFAPRQEIADSADDKGSIIADIRHTLRGLADHDANPSPADAPPRPKEGLFLPDAFSNPVYMQFALKTLLAVLIAYVFYTGAAWPGIHTVLLTCLIVAQPSLGATSRRSLLRIVGAAIGSLIVLVMVVFVVQRLDGIVGLLAITLPVIALAAWIAAGSERIAYAGTQIMFTFSMSLLTQFVPTTDLTEIRDRIVGIALGVGLSLLVHTGIAPETEGEALRKRLAELVRTLAALVRFPVGRTTQDRLSFSQEQLRASANYEDCEALLGRVTLEPDWQAGNADQEDLMRHTQSVLSQSLEILRALNAFKAECAARIEQSSPGARDAAMALETGIADELDRYSDCLGERPADTAPPPRIALDRLAQECRHDETSGRSAPGSLALLLAKADDLAHEVARLPRWTADDNPEAQLNASPA